MKHKMTVAQTNNWDSYAPTLEVGDTIKIIAEKKVVDLSKVIGTRVPMLFGNNQEQGYLTEITGEVYSYHSNEDAFPNCKFDTSEDAWVSWGPHVSWFTNECPIPKGVEYEFLHAQTNEIRKSSSIMHWKHWGELGGSAIIAFRITGLVEDWEYPE